MPQSIDVADVCVSVYMASTGKYRQVQAGTLDGLGTDVEVLGIHFL